MILPVNVIGNPVLRKIAVDVDENYEGLQQLIADMFETMYHSDGVGLAAPQVNHSIRLFVVDGKQLDEKNPDLKNFKRIFINAKIIETDGEEKFYNEGCLSLPSIREDVKRKDKIRMQYLDENFETHDEYFVGVQSRIIQHEYDHLEGILFVDHLSPFKKQLLKGRIGAIAKGKINTKYKTRIS